jgi:hypothetical protein
MGEDRESETIRWPTNLDRAAIEVRLDEIAKRANEVDLKVGQRFSDVKTMTAAQIASSVVASLTWLFDQPADVRAKYEDITRELEMVALNLKNLK